MKGYISLIVLMFCLLTAHVTFASKYGEGVALGDQKQCKDWCDTTYPQERGLCHDACYEQYPPGSGRPKPPPPGQNMQTGYDSGVRSRTAGGPQVFNMEQTLSLGAQTNTIAFDGLAFITGSLCADSFIPPGKVADFFGFQYLRDNDPTSMGHNTSFLTIVADNVLATLNDSQLNQLISLAEEQVSQIEQYALMRFPIMKAFRRNLEGDIPDGTTVLDLEAIKTASAALYRLDGEISIRRAQVLGSIIRSMDADQIAFFDGLDGTGVDDWPTATSPIDKRDYPHDVHVAIMTYASQLYSWYAGDIESDVYFCPERHGTYFGSFYMKDIPAMGQDDYTINENLTGDRGQDFLNVLTDSQAQTIRGIVDMQSDAMAGIVSTREEISRLLRMYMTTDLVDDETILELSEEYGNYDGELIYIYATTFAEVAETLSSEQMTLLEELRGLEDYSCQGMYLYSDPIVSPAIEDTDKFFGNEAFNKKGLPIGAALLLLGQTG